MAGQGFKDFSVGEVLTSADVDGYLMQQSVMRFADSAARGSALGTATGTGVPLAEGMVAYLDDVNQVQLFDGTFWRPTGTILQVVSTTKTDTFSHSFASAGGTQEVTGLSASITPVSTAHKVLVTVHVSVASSGGEPTGTGIVLKRAGTAISVGDAASNRTRTTSQQSGGGSMSISNVAVTFLDSPSTTSATSYTVDVFNADVGNRVIYVNRSTTDSDSVGYGRSTSSITLMEVAA